MDGGLGGGRRTEVLVGPRGGWVAAAGRGAGRARRPHYRKSAEGSRRASGGAMTSYPRSAASTPAWAPRRRDVTATECLRQRRLRRGAGRAAP